MPSCDDECCREPLVPWLAVAILGCGLTSVGAQVLPPEVQVGSADIVDYEFEWGRDGVVCEPCNGGAGNTRFTYVDTSHRLWVARVDPVTGDFLPYDGQGTLVGRNAVTAKEVGNGPEWALSQRGSEIIYTRWTDGLPRVARNFQLGFASMSAGAWTAGPLVGAQGRLLPFATLDAGDPLPSIHYQTTVTALPYWRDLVDGAPEQPIGVGAGSNTTRRWIAGTRDLLITAPGPAGPKDHVYAQIFLYHTLTGAMEQLTEDPINKVFAFMWKAPEFDNDDTMFTVINGRQFRIYRKVRRSDSLARWKVVNLIDMPDATPYIVSPEPFVHNGKSWIVFQLSANADPQNYAVPSLIAMTGIEPDTNTLRLLTSDTDPPRQRRDPEYFVTANGPYIYYDRYVLPTDNSPLTHEGVFRVDGGLGPRVGP